ncbi:MAG: 2OG-Fe(II) oxygenase [Gemmatimonadetes bacterium]|nr:2OG-Fe(II) oxygenase [Gemmatimonadota bacterium]
MPPGFIYRPNVLSSAEETELIERISVLPFKAFEFHGYTGKRRVVSYGWKYDYDAEVARPVDDIPPFLFSLRDTAAGVAGMEPQRLQQALITEYEPGSAIGWHKDKAVYGQVVGISLLSPCNFRLRRTAGDKWERMSLIVEPRSIYVLDGIARSEWEHSIPAVGALRYSITFRNLKER